MIKQKFDSGWETSEAVGMMAAVFGQWQPVTLPHDASISKPRSENNPTTGGGGFAWSGVVTYRNKFQVPEAWRGQCVQLEFEGVYMNAEVSVNHNLAALHPYGYTSFVVDLTPFLVYGAENEVSVQVNNSAQPNSRWYSGTGIYRHVWLRCGGNVHIKPWGVFVTTPTVSPVSATVAVATEIGSMRGSASGVVLRSSVQDAGGAVVAQVETHVPGVPNGAAAVRQTLNIAGAKLWSVDEPNLYTLFSEVLVNEIVEDTEITTFGIRSIDVDARNGLRLNGVPMKLKGGCVHHDNGLLGAASYDRAEERKIELMKACGYNAMRCAHNPPAPAMLDACDRLGMLVIDETFDCWRTGKNSNDYHLFFEDWWQRDSESMVLRDRNHPSIFMWSIGNELPERTGISDGVAWAHKQANFVRSLDATRLVTSAVPLLFEEMIADPAVNLENIFDLGSAPPSSPQQDRWGNATREFNQELDVVGYNYLCDRYAYDGEHFPGRVIAGTETFPHRAYAYWDATLRLPHVIGDFVWTSIDYLGESGIGRVSVDDTRPFFAQKPWPFHLAHCGDIDICGFKRPQSYFRDLLWGVRSAPYIGVLDPQLYGKKLAFSPWGWEPVSDSWTFAGWEGKPTQVFIYCADDEVELLINGVSAGRKPAGAASQNKVVFEVVYQPGMIEAVGFSGGIAVGKTILKTASEPVSLRLNGDRLKIHQEYGDLAYVTVEIVDRNGQRVPWVEAPLSFEIEGPGELIALGTANPLSEELYVGSSHKAWNGRLMAVVRTNGQAGEIVLKAQTDGLPGAQIRLEAA